MCVCVCVFRGACWFPLETTKHGAPSEKKVEKTAIHIARQPGSKMVFEIQSGRAHIICSGTGMIGHAYQTCESHSRD